jgi:hypothetical protein
MLSALEGALIISLARRESPLVEFKSEPQCGLLPQSFPHDENEVGPPRMMMPSAAAPAANGLTQLISRAIISGHDMRQLMKTCLLASIDAQPVVRADLHPALTGVSVAASPAAHNGHRVRVCREGALEPLHLLDGTDVGRAKPVIYCPIILDKHREG